MEKCEGCGNDRELRNAVVAKDDDQNPIWGHICDDCVTKVLMGELGELHMKYAKKVV